MAVYLLHFDKPYQHARHYLGYAADDKLHQRIDRHYDATPGDGHHHRLMQVVKAAGISFTLARVWPHGTRADERKKKKQGGKSRMCPICLEAKRKGRRPREEPTNGHRHSTQ